ncbi:MAG: hypothetical protein WA087_02815 [Candidatus Saccharimonadales bacterium]
MDIQPQTTKPISDDQELAKALAGVSEDSDELNFEETPLPAPTATPEAEKAPVTEHQTTSELAPSPAEEAVAEMGIDLNVIKKDAITELRPLVDKLDLNPEEKFDIYLLILRSTDDKTLIAPAHAAARNIVDEARRAQALLDIIKEIDYLSSPHPAAE